MKFKQSKSKSFHEMLKNLKTQSITTISKRKSNFNDEFLRISLGLICIYYECLPKVDKNDKIYQQNQGLNQFVFLHYYNNPSLILKAIKDTIIHLGRNQIKPEQVLLSKLLIKMIKFEQFTNNSIDKSLVNILYFLHDFIIFYQDKYGLKNVKPFKLVEDGKQRSFSLLHPTNELKVQKKFSLQDNATNNNLIQNKKFSNANTDSKLPSFFIQDQELNINRHKELQEQQNQYKRRKSELNTTGFQLNDKNFDKEPEYRIQDNSIEEQQSHNFDSFKPSQQQEQNQNENNNIEVNDGTQDYGSLNQSIQNQQPSQFTSFKDVANQDDLQIQQDQQKNQKICPTFSNLDHFQINSARKQEQNDSKYEQAQDIIDQNHFTSDKKNQHDFFLNNTQKIELQQQRSNTHNSTESQNTQNDESQEDEYSQISDASLQSQQEIKEISLDKNLQDEQKINVNLDLLVEKDLQATNSNELQNTQNQNSHFGSYINNEDLMKYISVKIQNMNQNSLDFKSQKVQEQLQNLDLWQKNPNNIIQDDQDKNQFKNFQFENDFEILQTNNDSIHSKGNNFESKKISKKEELNKFFDKQKQQKTDLSDDIYYSLPQHKQSSNRKFSPEYFSSKILIDKQQLKQKDENLRQDIQKKELDKTSQNNDQISQSANSKKNQYQNSYQHFRDQLDDETISQENTENQIDNSFQDFSQQKQKETIQKFDDEQFQKQSIDNIHLLDQQSYSNSKDQKKNYKNEIQQNNDINVLGQNKKNVINLPQKNDLKNFFQSQKQIVNNNNNNQQKFSSISNQNDLNQKNIDKKIINFKQFFKEKYNKDKIQTLEQIQDKQQLDVLKISQNDLQKNDDNQQKILDIEQFQENDLQQYLEKNGSQQPSQNYDKSNQFKDQKNESHHNENKDIINFISINRASQQKDDPADDVINFISIDKDKQYNHNVQLTQPQTNKDFDFLNLEQSQLQNIKQDNQTIELLNLSISNDQNDNQFKEKQIKLDSQNSNIYNFFDNLQQQKEQENTQFYHSKSSNNFVKDEQQILKQFNSKDFNIQNYQNKVINQSQQDQPSLKNIINLEYETPKKLTLIDDKNLTKQHNNFLWNQEQISQNESIQQQIQPKVYENDIIQKNENIENNQVISDQLQKEQLQQNTKNEEHMRLSLKQKINKNQQLKNLKRKISQSKRQISINRIQDIEEEGPRQISVKKINKPQNLIKSQKQVKNLKTRNSSKSIVKQYIQDPQTILKYHKHQALFLNQNYQEYLELKKQINKMKTDLNQKKNKIRDQDKKSYEKYIKLKEEINTDQQKFILQTQNKFIEETRQIQNKKRKKEIQSKQQEIEYQKRLKDIQQKNEKRLNYQKVFQKVNFRNRY